MNFKIIISGLLLCAAALSPAHANELLDSTSSVADIDGNGGSLSSESSLFYPEDLPKLIRGKRLAPIATSITSQESCTSNPWVVCNTVYYVSPGWSFSVDNSGNARLNTANNYTVVTSNGRNRHGGPGAGNYNLSPVGVIGGTSGKPGYRYCTARMGTFGKLCVDTYADGGKFNIIETSSGWIPQSAGPGGQQSSVKTESWSYWKK